MAIISKITLSMMNGRFDSEYYQPKYLEISKRLSKYETKKLVSIANVNGGKRLPLGHSLKIDGIPYVRVVDISDGFIHRNQIAYINESTWQYINSYDIKEDDVLVTIVGNTVGLTGILKENLGTANFTENCARIRNCKLGANYILAYLLSKYGQVQVEREKVGTAQPKLSLDRLRRFVIPIFKPNELNEINLYINSSSKCRNDSNRLYNQAQQLLESELGLDKLSFQRSKGYTARFSTIELSDTFNANRIDAQCFVPEAIFYKEWLLKHTQCDLLGYLLQNTTKGRQQNETIDGTADYCSIKHINGRELTNVGKCFPANGTPLATANDLLLAITGATIGKIGIVKRYSQLTFSGDLLRLRVKPEINPHYLLLLLDHPLGQVQFNRWITGSTNGHLAPRDIKRVLVPRLKEESETRIATLVEESLTKRVESESLLEQAKTRVEQLIEEAVQ